MAKKSMAIDNHHASKNGQKNEKRFAKKLKDILNLTVLRRKADFKRHGCMELYDHGRKLLHPPEWSYDKNRKSGRRGSESDGVIKEFRLPFELKSAEVEGTTPKGIWWEYIKICEGITPNRYLFVFSGRLEHEYHAVNFMRLVDKNRESGNERFTHVHCVRESELTVEWLNARYAQNTPHVMSLF